MSEDFKCQADDAAKGDAASDLRSSSTERGAEARCPVILCGDHAEFEAEHANTSPHDRPDWPLPSFDAQDWAEAFCKTAKVHGHEIDEGWMIGWFANALMRGHDEGFSRAQRQTGASCPSVHRLVIDGKRHLMIVGKSAHDRFGTDRVEDEPVNRCYGALIAEGKIGDDELVILIEEDLLSGIGCQAEVAAVGSAVPPSAPQSNDSAEAVGQYGETKSDQAYQVIGTLASVANCFEDPEVQRALDYFSGDGFDPKFLPFKRPRPIDEAGTADERTAEQRDGSLTSND